MEDIEAAPRPVSLVFARGGLPAEDDVEVWDDSSASDEIDFRVIPPPVMTPGRDLKEKLQWQQQQQQQTPLSLHLQEAAAGGADANTAPAGESTVEQQQEEKVHPLVGVGSARHNSMATRRQLPQLPLPPAPVHLRVNAGWSHCMAVTAAGAVWAWGDGELGVLADKDVEFHGAAAPVLVRDGLPSPDEDPAVQVVAAAERSVVLTRAGDLYCWGRGVGGCLGDADPSDHLQLRPRRLRLYSSSTSVSSSSAVQPPPLGLGRLSYSLAAALDPIRAVACGKSHCLALTSSGRVLAWGAAHLCGGAAMDEGTADDQAGGTRSSSSSSGSSGSSGSSSRRRRGHSSSSSQEDEDDDEDEGKKNLFILQPRQVPLGGQGAVAIGAGLRHSVALTALTGVMLTWGMPSPFPSSLPSPASSTSSPSSFSSSFSPYVHHHQQQQSPPHQDLLFGNLGDGIIRRRGRDAERPAPVQGMGDHDASSRNKYDPVYQGTATSISSSSTSSTSSSTRSGSSSSSRAASPSSGSRRTNNQNQLVARSSDVIVQISIGQEHSLALSSNGRVLAWGHGAHGRLGDGDASDHVVAMPAPVRGLPDPGACPVVDISAGHCHNLCLTASGAVYAWGLAKNGRLGDSSEDYRNVGTACAVSRGLPPPTTSSSLPSPVHGASGLIGGHGSDSGGSSSSRGGERGGEQVQTADRVVSVTAGRAHSMAVTRSGAVYAWGRGDDGRLADDELSPHNVTSPRRVHHFHAGYVAHAEGVPV